jgi:hypothetical protein
LSAREVKATWRPSPLITGSPTPPFGGEPSEGVAHRGGLPGLEIVHDDAISVADKGDMAAVAADRGFRGQIGGVVAPPEDPLLRLLLLAVVDERVGGAIVVAGHQVRGLRDEGHIAAVGADRRGGHADEAALPVRIRAVGGDAHPGGPTRLELVDERVAEEVGVLVF